ncbi:MAG TPA: SigE family RNA polymerase sigma factor [Mycobacteriales bacterium]|nr:SigE family RNA polymerase sigma factor [Mycobacteriales bacterium]
MSESTQLPSDPTQAVSALFVAHHRRLVGLAYLLVEDLETAEDVVQDAFTALYRRWAWIRDPNAALAYLQTSVANGARSSLRRKYRRRTPFEREADIPSAEATAVAHDEQRRIEQEVMRLPSRQRQVVVLRYYLDQSESEIASALSISRGSVKQHASRALAALTLRLEASR